VAKEHDLAQLTESGIVAVVRGDDANVLCDVVSALKSGGVTAIEITFTVPKATRVLEQVADQFGDSVLLGAGTVLDSETARAALLAGARYIVSPCVNLDVIEMCQRYDKLVMPGALTPTEVITAWQAGGDIIKIFPSDLTGPSYLKALAGPFPQVKLMPTGGVNLDTMTDFLDAGAVAVGVGGSLVEKKAVTEGNFQRIEELAQKYVSLLLKAREKTV
jgi:2-dehydro-3-deoxyphosphogluconate aldolase/(4S)-4-hydroxy-2-oxoglutarate aldolase